MSPYLFTLGIAGFLFYFLTPIAHNVGLVDRPNSRKHHRKPTPLTGGISIFIAIMMGALLLPIGLGVYRMLFFSMTLIVLIGILDDHQDVSAKIKFLFQVVTAVLLVVMDDKVVLFIGDILFSGHQQGLGPVAIPFTIIAIVGVINAFNMIDGHDGLTGGVTLTTLLAIILLLHLKPGMASTLPLLYLLAIAVSVFLIYNLECLVGRNRQVFLGDSGSMLIGLILVYFLIDLTSPKREIISVTAAAWFIGLPLLDMMNVFILRITQGRSPLVADRLHIHHFLLDLGLGKYTVLMVLLMLHFVFVLIGLIGTLHHWPDIILFWGMFLVLALYLVLSMRIRLKNRAKP